jgi:hypothetical protein
VHSKADVSSRNAAHPLTALHHAHGILLLRWVLIVATSYLVLFSRPLSELTHLVTARSAADETLALYKALGVTVVQE